MNSRYLLTGGGAALTRESNVTHYFIDGEALNYPRYSWDTLVGNEYVFSIGGSTAGSIERHSMALMAAIQYSNEYPNLFHDVVKKLPDLVTQLLDTNLFATDSRDPNKEDLLRRLLRHQIGISGAIQPDKMLERFASDMNKLAQDGGLTMSDSVIPYVDSNKVSSALTAFAMQFYYEDTANATNANKQLFTDLTTAGSGSNGIQFDMTEVSKDFAATLAQSGKGDLSQVKGYQYFQTYLNRPATTPFSPEERALIQSLLPAMRDWYIQAGTAGMNATDTLNRGAFMLGGNGADALVGGTSADLLVGNAGTDLLQGGKGNDFLLGGAGNDAYVYTSGDGFDTILDTDGQGRIVMDGATLAGDATQYGDSRVHRDTAGHLYVSAGNNLIIDGNILVQNYSNGNLDLNMTGPAAEPANPVTTLTITGDIIPTDIDLTKAGIQAAPDAQWNPLGTAGPYEDRLIGTAGNDHILSGELGDVVYAGNGDDWIEGGNGNDILVGGYDNLDSNDLIEGGAGRDILWGYTGNDRLYANVKIDNAAAIANGNNDAGSGQIGEWLSGNEGDDTLVAGADNDVLAGGAGNDLIIAGAGDDIIFGDADYSRQYFMVAPVTLQYRLESFGSWLDWNVISPDSFNWKYTDSGSQIQFTGSVFGEASPAGSGVDVIYAGNGNDIAFGGNGNDVIFGEDGIDRLYGGDGNDILIGGTGNDTLDGGAGTDIYVYNKDDGEDNILEKTSGNILRFGAGIGSSDITLKLGSLLLDLGNGDAVHIGNFDQNDVFNSSSIGSFEFAPSTGIVKAGSYATVRMRRKIYAAIFNRGKAANDETANARRDAA